VYDFSMRKLVMLPGPTNVSPRVMNAMLNSIINHRGEEFHELYRKLRSGIQEVFQTQNEIVVLSASGTGGVDATAGSLFSEGDSVVVPEFGEFSSRLGDSVRYTGANVIAPQAELGKAPSVQEIEKAMQEAVKPKALCLVYNETSTGVTWRELESLGRIAKEYGALFIVDAISVMGGDELPVDKLGIDVCIAGSQKCLAAPPGLVLLSFSQKAKEAMTQKKPRTQYFDMPRYFKFAEHDEIPSTPSLPLFFALEQAIDTIREEGMEKRIKRHSVCANAFYSAFRSIGLSPLAEEKYRSNVVLGIKYPPGVEDAKFRSLLSNRFGVIIAGGFGKLKGSMFRIGSMGDIDASMVCVTIESAAEALKISGYDCEPSKALSSAWDELKAL
jgi:aspartate aminotransferase-like enzyme